jgi:predicted nuclease of predicted toxin-antitoxin system
LKFLVDVGVSKAVEEWLRSEGYDVVTVRDLDPRMPDIDILEEALRESRLVLTMDKDFGELVYSSGKAYAGVLLLRLAGARSEEKVAVVRNILQRYSEKLLGSFAVYQNGRLRVRKRSHKE